MLHAPQNGNVPKSPSGMQNSEGKCRNWRISPTCMTRGLEIFLGCVQRILPLMQLRYFATHFSHFGMWCVIYRQFQCNPKVAMQKIDLVIPSHVFLFPNCNQFWSFFHFRPKEWLSPCWMNKNNFLTQKIGEYRWTQNFSLVNTLPECLGQDSGLNDTRINCNGLYKAFPKDENKMKWCHMRNPYFSAVTGSLVVFERLAQHKKTTQHPTHEDFWHHFFLTSAPSRGHPPRTKMTRFFICATWGILTPDVSGPPPHMPPTAPHTQMWGLDFMHVFIIIYLFKKCNGDLAIEI